MRIAVAVIEPAERFQQPDKPVQKAQNTEMKLREGMNIVKKIFSYHIYVYVWGADDQKDLNNWLCSAKKTNKLHKTDLHRLLLILYLSKSRQNLPENEQSNARAS